MSDLVQRLRFGSIDDDLLDAAKEAADEIERLRVDHAAAMAAMDAEIERLRAALNDIAQHQDSEWPLRCRMNVRTARAALKEPT